MEFWALFQDRKVEITEDAKLLADINDELKRQLVLFLKGGLDIQALSLSVTRMNSLLAGSGNQCYEVLPSADIRQVIVDGRQHMSCYHDPPHYFPPLDDE